MINISLRKKLYQTLNSDERLALTKISMIYNINYDFANLSTLVARRKYSVFA